MSDSTAYGCVYNPSVVSRDHIPNIIELKERKNVRFIRFTWVDLSNKIRYRVIPISHFERIMKASRPSITVTSATVGIVMNTRAPGFHSMGVQHFVPDMSSLRLASYAPRAATLMGFFNDSDGQISGTCPRGLLKRVLDEAATQTSTQFLIGFETEFIFLRVKGDDRLVPGNDHPWCDSRAMLTGSPEAQALEGIVEILEDAGICVEMFHAEAAAGQYEIVTGPLPPLEAADALIFTRETILNVGAKHGLHATFAPRVSADDFGSGAHVHISLHGTEDASGHAHGKKLPPGPAGLSGKEASFVAGVLAHLPALTALLLPTAESYTRVTDHLSTGGTYVCWGSDNREAPIRACGSSGSKHFELKTLDGTANPYVALAAVLGAGVRAIEKGAKLEMGEAKLPAVDIDADEREALGIRDRLPRSVDEARECLTQDGVVMEILGEIGKVWKGVNKHVENILDEEKEKHEDDIGKVMVDHY